MLSSIAPEVTWISQNFQKGVMEHNILCVLDLSQKLLNPLLQHWVTFTNVHVHIFMGDSLLTISILSLQSSLGLDAWFCGCRQLSLRGPLAGLLS